MNDIQVSESFEVLPPAEGTPLDQVPTLLSRKSWVAYLKPTFLALLAWGISGPLAFSTKIWAGVLLTLIVLAIYAYAFLTVKSYKLYMNDIGVWLQWGILPWNKALYMVKWRDIDEAGCPPGFLSWALRSYTIRVGHRFTKTSEIRATHMHRGDKAAVRINDYLAELVRNKAVN